MSGEPHLLVHGARMRSTKFVAHFTPIAILEQMIVMR